jgi:carbamoyl-phosphate synthase large subunit
MTNPQATTMVTGAGGPAGVNVIRALEGRGVATVGVDADPDAVGLHLSTASAVVPRCDDPSFCDALIAIGTDMGVNAVISTVAEELIVLARHVDQLEAAGIHSWIPDANAIERCVDKWLFAKTVANTDTPAPKTGLASDAGIPGPWIVKPRFGRGSRDVIPVDDAAELAWALRRVPEPIVQTRLTGREFTVDTLTDHSGNLIGAVPRWRLETKAGISTKGMTFQHDELTHSVDQLLQALDLTGPANVQGFVHDDNTFHFIEVNPRFSGGLALSQAAGADLIGEYLRGIHGQTPRPEALTYQPNTTMKRYFNEIFDS